jgi:hypothetical protein
MIEHKHIQSYNDLIKEKSGCFITVFLSYFRRKETIAQLDSCSLCRSISYFKVCLIPDEHTHYQADLIRCI